MNNSIKFKAAHKLAKAYQVKMNGGDYAVYFSHALKLVNLGFKRAAKMIDGEQAALTAMNKAIKKISKESGVTLLLITRKVKRHFSHGTESFTHRYKKEKRERELTGAYFFGMEWVKDRVIYANLRSTKYVDEAY